MQWTLLHPKATVEHLGLLPSFLSEDDPRPAKEQIAERYVGGWHPHEGFTLGTKAELYYPDDPVLYPIACVELRQEIICLYPHSWVVILQPTGTFEVARCD